MILAPLRGVTIRCFRETFAEEIRAAGFTEAITPFITANAGYDPLRDRELQKCSNVRMLECSNADRIKITPQFIGKDPVALRTCLEKVKASGYDTADLNCGREGTPAPEPYGAGVPPPPHPRSSRSFSGSKPSIAVINGVTASVKPAARISSAKVSRKHLIVTPLKGARIMRSDGRGRG